MRFNSWRLVGGMGEEERALLLQFCTGCSVAPAGGFCELKAMGRIHTSIPPYLAAPPPVCSLYTGRSNFVCGVNRAPGF